MHCFVYLNRHFEKLHRAQLKSGNYYLLVYPKYIPLAMIFYTPWSHKNIGKCQNMSKWSSQAKVSSKKQTNEFYFTTMKAQVDLFSFVFWRKLMTPKRHFEIKWPLVCIFWRIIYRGYGKLNLWNILANPIYLEKLKGIIGH